MNTPEPSTEQRSWVNGQAVIPAVCATHEAQVIDLMVRGFRDGLITLGPHDEGGCVFTVQAVVLFDLLGEWLG